jgi:hypothetical protein
MINRTDAWKCTDGTCFEVDDKEKAYNHEIKTLMQTLPRGSDRQITAFHLRRLVEDVKKWLVKAKRFDETLQRVPRDRRLLVVKEYYEMLQEVRTWFESAQGLVDQIKEEEDVKTSRAMAGQVG